MKTTISGYIAALMSLLAMAATVPSELQSQIMSCFPEKIRPYTALFFALAGFIAKGYQSQHTQDAKPTVKDSLTVQPTEQKPQ